MAMLPKIINTLFILFVVYMGFKQGWAMLTGKSELVAMFNKWQIGQVGTVVLGTLTMLGAVLVLFPQTFIWGNFITASVILLLIAFFLHERDLKGVATEVPFFLLSLLIIYLQHPLANQR